MDPREIHERDQQDAAAREMARELRVFWSALRAEGFSDPTADRLTEAFLVAQLSGGVYIEPDADE